MGGKTMKFLALVKKEFRECLPWICLALIAYTGIGCFILRQWVLNADYHRKRVFQQVELTSWQSWHMSPVSDFGPLLLITALGLGLAMGIRQFYVPGFDKTWAFTLHRPIRPSTAVHAKLFVALLGLALSVGLPWTAMYLYAAAPGRFLVPVLPRIFWEGWFMIGMGFLLYLGTAVSGLCRARWYTTKVFGLAFASAIVFMAMTNTPYPAPLVLESLGLVVLGVQVYALMQSREL
jgi:hypothetical protein